MELEEKIDQYFSLQKEIHEAFGYQEDYRVIPMDDARDVKWWFLTDEKSGKLYYGYTELTEEIALEGNEFYSSEIYTQRHLPKWVYRTNQYTLVCNDTHADLNVFLTIFPNDKELKDEKLKASVTENWGF